MSISRILVDCISPSIRTKNFILQHKVNFQNISGSLVDKTNIFWDGNAEPAIFMTLQTIQNLNAELNQKCSSDLSKYLSQAFEVPLHRYILL